MPEKLTISMEARNTGNQGGLAARSGTEFT